MKYYTYSILISDDFRRFSFCSGYLYKTAHEANTAANKERRFLNEKLVNNTIADIQVHEMEVVDDSQTNS